MFETQKFHIICTEILEELVQFHSKNTGTKKSYKKSYILNRHLEKGRAFAEVLRSQDVLEKLWDEKILGRCA